MHDICRYLLCSLFTALVLAISFSAYASLGSSDEEDFGQTNIGNAREAPYEEDLLIQPSKPLESREVPSSTNEDPRRSEKIPLLNEVALAHEPLQDISGNSAERHKRTLKNKMGGRIVGQTSAAVSYPPDKLVFKSRDVYSEEDYSPNLPFITLHKIDNVLFDDTKGPRVLFSCCHPGFLKFLELLGGSLGMVSLGLIAPGFTNGILGELFNYPPYGDVSIGVMIVSATLMMDVAFLEFYGATRKIVRKHRSNFLSATSSEELYDSDNNNDGVFVFPHSNFSKIIQFGVLPLFSMGYAGQPVGLFLDVERGFFNFALPLSFPMLLFYAKSYYQMAQNLWEEQYFTHYYIISHESREQRRALLQSLRQIKSALLRDTDYSLTKAMWLPIAKRTNYFGSKENPSSYSSNDTISAISCLFCRPAAIVEEDQHFLHNRLTSRLGIEEDSSKDKLFHGVSIIVMALNLYPNFMMVSETIEKLTTSPITGYVAGAFLSFLLLIEAKNFQNWLHKTFAPNCCDPQDPYLRFFLRRKNNLFTLLNTAIFLADYYFAMSGESLKTLWFFMPFVAVRFFAFFDMLSENLDDQAVSSFARRNKTNPTPSQKKKQLLEYINRLEPLIDHKFTDSVIDRITQAIFMTK